MKLSLPLKFISSCFCLTQKSFLIHVPSYELTVTFKQILIHVGQVFIFTRNNYKLHHKRSLFFRTEALDEEVFFVVL